MEDILYKYKYSNFLLHFKSDALDLVRLEAGTTHFSVFHDSAIAESKYLSVIIHRV